MKTYPFCFRRFLVLLVPMCLGLVSILALGPDLEEGQAAVLTERKKAGKVAPVGEKSPVFPDGKGKEVVAEEALVKSVITTAAVPVWEVVPDEVPVSHWAPGTGGPQPLRSGKLVGDWAALKEAAVGGAVAFPLFDGQVAKGVLRRTVEVEPGTRIWSGRLVQPEGRFFLERNARGWRGTLTLAKQPVAYRIFPGPAGHEGPWLERWAREDIECSQVGGSDYDPDSPELDPGVDASNLQSRPGAPRVIYLDFNGGWIDNTYWNSEYNEDERINFASSNLSVDDRVRAWAHAAEDFKAFNVNVTNVKSAYDAVGSSNRVYVVITPTKSWYGDDPDEEVTAKGGVSEIGSYGSSGCVAWVWNTNWLSAGDTISHEAGHALGLYHSGYYNIVENDYQKYYHGHGEGSAGWAPIMGVGFDEPRYLTTWDNGSYPWATSDQNQKFVLGEELGSVSDDHGDSTSAATTLPAEGNGPIFQGKGRLDAAADIDFFRLQLPAGTWAFQVWGNKFGRNVNLTIQVRNGLNEMLDETDWQDSPDATAALQLPAGTHYLTIRSTVREESDEDPGFPRYGQLGTYSILVLPFGYEATPPVAHFQSLDKFVLGSGYADLEVRYTDETLLDSATLGSGDVKMQRGSDTPLSGQLFSVGGTGANRTVRYRFAAPSADWDIGEGGSYRFYVPAGAVKDDWGNGIVETNLGTFSLPATDPAPPQVTIPGGLSNASQGTDPYTFRIAVSDVAPVLVSESGKNCVEVRRATSGEGLTFAGPLTPARTGAASSNYNKSWTVDYSLAPPGGTWDETDIGEYQIWLRGGKVRDVNGNVSPAQQLGTFYLRKTVWTRTFDETGLVLLFGLDSGWSVGTPAGTGGYLHDPTGPYNGTDALGYRLGSGDAALYQNNIITARYATSPAINTTGYRNLAIQFRRWLSVRAGDRVRLQVNRDGGAWTTVWQNEADSAINDTTWRLEEIDLPPAIADNTTALRFRFSLGTTDGAETAGGWTVDNIKIIAAGLFNPGRLIVNNVGSSVTEGAELVRVYNVRLDQAPTSPVTVEIDPGTQISTSRSSLTFTASNYNTAQNVVISAVDDLVVEGNQLSGLVHRISDAGTDPAYFGVQTFHLLTVNDNDAPLIETQPQDAAVAPGQSALFRVVPVTTALKGYQWYLGQSGDTSNPISGATLSQQSVLLPVGSTQPVPVWVRVRVNLVGGTREDSETAWLSPLKGYAAWKSLLRNHGYNTAALEAAGFDAADPDGDGLGHFMEYAFGGQPYTADQRLLPQVSLERAVSGGTGTGTGVIGLPGSGTGGKKELVLRFGPMKADVRYGVETSGDLRNWRVFRTETAADRTVLGRGTLAETVIRIPMTGESMFARIRAEYVAP